MSEPSPRLHQPAEQTSSPAYRLPADTPPPAFGPPPARPPRKLWPWIAGAAVLLVVIGVVAAVALLGRGGNPFEAARDECGGSAPDVIIGDGGKTLIIDGAGSDALKGGASEQMQVCYVKALKTPDSVIAHIAGTRALDGRQTDQWGDISAAWTYHPDAGLYITFTRK